MAATETLFEDGALILRARAGDPSRPAVVTFSDAHYRPGPDVFWGDDVLARMGWPAFGFVARRPDWFPAVSVAAAAAALRGRLGPVAIGYGFSMGGYGVLRYGRGLGLSHALALSPQASIAPGDVPRDHRHRSLYVPALHRDMRVRPGDAPPVSWVLYDPLHRDDADNLALLAQPGLRPVPVHGVYHSTLRLLAGAAPLEAAFRALLAEDAPALRHLLRDRRRALPMARGMFGAVRLSQGRTASGAVLLEEARRRGMDAAEEMDALGQATAEWQGRGGPRDAGESLRARILGLKDLPGGRVQHAKGNALLALGAPEAALAAFRRAERDGVGPMARRGQHRAARALWVARTGGRWVLRPLAWVAAWVQVGLGILRG